MSQCCAQNSYYQRWGSQDEQSEEQGRGRLEWAKDSWCELTWGFPQTMASLQWLGVAGVLAQVWQEISWQRRGPGPWGRVNWGQDWPGASRAGVFHKGNPNLRQTGKKENPLWSLTDDRRDKSRIFVVSWMSASWFPGTSFPYRQPGLPWFTSLP